MRRSEVCAPSIGTFDPRHHLTMADVSLHTSGVTVTIRHTKNMQKYNQTQTQHLDKSTDPLLCPWMALVAAVILAPTRHPTDPMIMFSDRNPVTANYVADQWAQVLAKLKAPPMFYTLHSLRKTATDTAHKAGATIDEVKDFGAWRSNAVWAYVQKSASKTIATKLANALKTA